MAEKIEVLKRNSRRSQYSIAIIIALGLLAMPSVALSADGSTNNQGRQLSLRDQLTKGLKAFTKADFAFIDKVVLKVKLGKLPERLVNGTFLWARDRAARKSRSRELRPMVYFRPALTLQAKKIGVKL